jgi:periplasmic protein TonB
MKFVKLKSRGGDYLIVASQVAWLRTHEDGQTKVGIVGGDYLLVAGTIEETAATILAELAPGNPAG